MLYFAGLAVLIVAAASLVGLVNLARAHLIRNGEWHRHDIRTMKLWKDGRWHYRDMTQTEYEEDRDERVW
ncbi:putative membrane-bound mannosyltransferase [Bradyrhizobium sp. GM24.11]